MIYSEYHLPAVGTEVSLVGLLDDYTPNDLPRGTVVDHNTTKPPEPLPDLGMVLVRWSDTYFRWEYSDDLQDAADYLAKM